MAITAIIILVLVAGNLVLNEIIRRKVNKIMASIQDVLDSFNRFKADIAAEVDALKAKLDAGGAVESADLDKIKAAIDSADAEIPPAA